MLSILLSTWLACTPPDARPALPPLGPAAGSPRAWTLGPPGATVLHLLDGLAETALDVAPDNLPPTGASEGRIPLQGPWTTTGHGVWSHPSPVIFSQLHFRAAPLNITLWRGDEALAYAPGTGTVARQEGGWEIASNVIYLASDEDPTAWSLPPTLVHPAVARAETRLNRSLSGLDPVAFARARIAIQGVTRDALLLGAPGSAAFTVDLEAGARLRFGWGIAVPAEGVAAAEPARATLAVQVDGEQVWTRPATAGEPWQEADLDLSRWGGRRVTLAFRTDPDGDPVGDFAAFGNPEVVGPATASGPRRVVVIGIDTLRPDHLGTHGYARATSPGLDEIASQSVVFDRAWAPAPRTRPSFRTSVTGRWPLPAIEAPTFGQVLSSAGFTTAGVVANVHLAPRLGFADGFGWWNFHESGDAAEQVDRALDWLRRHAEDDVALFLHFMDPHVFYLAPEPFTNLFTGGLLQGPLGDRYNRWIVTDMDRAGQLDEQAKAFMRARYDGEIAYMDAEILRFVRALDEMGGRTLLVVHSDHGEEFWEHGGYEHNHSLYDEVMRAALWFRPPGGWTGGPYRKDIPASIADIPPTIYDAAGIPREQWPEMEGVSLLGLLQPEEDADTAARLARRPLQLGHLMFDTERWGVVQGDGKYILHTASGEEELYDLAADPREQQDLADARQADLPPWRRALAEATGFEVGPGLRVQLMGQVGPFSLRFPLAVDAAGVIDPEAQRERRANLEWGEAPPVLPEDVATVTLSEDRRTVQVTPGPLAQGIVYVLGPASTRNAQIIDRAGIRNLVPGKIRLGGGPARVWAGTVIVPTDSEARRLAAIDDPDAIEALRALGYLQ